ncbi:MAG: TetR/AcrR family transcriptional regulator [Acidobacteriota bacterium]
MPSRKKPRLARESWVAAGMKALVERGVQAVSVEPLAKELGVTKGSFYWHFASRAELLESLLETWEREGTLSIIEAVEARASSPAERLERLVLTTTKTTPYDELEGALRDWARTDALAAAAVGRVDRRRLRYVTDLLVATGLDRARSRRRANIFYRTLIGEFTYRSTGGRALSRRELEDVVHFLLAGQD